MGFSKGVETYIIFLCYLPGKIMWKQFKLSQQNFQGYPLRMCTDSFRSHSQIFTTAYRLQLTSYFVIHTLYKQDIQLYEDILLL
jgi:hypothetical protein